MANQVPLAKSVRIVQATSDGNLQSARVLVDVYLATLSAPASTLPHGCFRAVFRPSGAAVIADSFTLRETVAASGVDYVIECEEPLDQISLKTALAWDVTLYFSEKE